MGLIIDFAKNEEELEDFSTIWERYREFSRTGFSEYTTPEIGNLHAEFCMVLAHKQMQLAITETHLDISKVHKELSYARVFHKVSISAEKKTDKQKDVIALVDQEYNNEIGKWLEIKSKHTIAKAEVLALETAVSGLSRELSRRLKI